MFTDQAQALIDLAKDIAFAAGAPELRVRHLLGAVARQAAPAVIVAEACACRPPELRAACPEVPEPVACPNALPLENPLRALVAEAQTLADDIPDAIRPGQINLRHVAGAIALSPAACELLGFRPRPRGELHTFLTAAVERDARRPSLDNLTSRARAMRGELLARIFGQDHAVHAFVEGLFNAELTATADLGRRGPRCVFVFAGPPGVGKTYLAELGARYLHRPFRRFDMSAYSGSQQGESLTGSPKVYKGAEAGVLTGFVERNPNAVLLFDEIEKAHAKTIYLFLQILDVGTLEDKFHERNVNFRDTTVIFTTNAGSQLYDRPNESGVNAANSAFHRKTIIDALASERDPETRQPFFPGAICSRLATGYPVLFNHLGVNELQRVADAELLRVSDLFERQYFKRVEYAPELPLALVLREGAQTDARTLRSQVELFVKTEIFKFCQLFNTDRLEQALDNVDVIRLELDRQGNLPAAGASEIFDHTAEPAVLLITSPEIADACQQTVTGVHWTAAASREQALDAILREELDMVLVDLWLGRDPQHGPTPALGFDHVPAAARELDAGQEILRALHERAPHLPVFLLSFAPAEAPADASGAVDAELLLACVRAGGARGALVSRFRAEDTDLARSHAQDLGRSLVATCQRLHREKTAARLGRERKVLSFATVPEIDADTRTLHIRVRGVHLVRAISANDAGELVESVERPTTRFDDVVGAEAAKKELRFFIDYLRQPRRFAAQGLDPPRGVLLHGPPGTGKTMLARAMAGESDVAFISAAASNFVTMWQGSGPQSVRDLFARARRYAPAIVFIDEIDAVGKERTGAAGGGRAEENTLNSLLTEMDGFSGQAVDRPVFILAATNFEIESGGNAQRKLDPALVRRFSRAIKVDLPERDARERFLQARLAGRGNTTVSSAAIRGVGARSTGMSIADLQRIVDLSRRRAVEEGRELDDALFEEAFELVRFGEARAREAAEVVRTARHEAGHTLMYWLAGYYAPYVTVVSRGDHGGYMAMAPEDVERGSRTKADLEARLRVSLGGRAAELLCYGEREGLSTGASGDLESATNCARQMICCYGMSDEFGLVASPELLRHAEALSSPLRLRLDKAVRRLLDEQMAECERLFGRHRERFDRLVDELARRERLNQEDLQALLPADDPDRSPRAAPTP